MKKSKIFSVIVLFVFLFSKFHYVSLYSISSFNFSLSDVCLILMLCHIVIKKKRILSVYKNVILISFMMLVFITIGSTLQNTLVVHGAIIYVKRWLSMLLIPLFMSISFSKEDISLVLSILFLSIVYFSISNIELILESLSGQRLMGSFNPNVIGMVFSIVFIFLINYISPKHNVWTKLVFSAICIIVVIATSSRGALFSLVIVILIRIAKSFKKTTRKGVVTFLGLSILMISFFSNIQFIVKNVFRYSYHRIYNTIQIGLHNDTSFSSRLITQSIIIQVIFASFSLLLFGTGFGNENMFLVFSRYDYIIFTADSMFVNIFAWSGLLGLICFTYIIFIIFRHILLRKESLLRDPLIYVTIYMTIAGLAQDTFTEPTIGAVYFVLLGMLDIDLGNSP